MSPFCDAPPDRDAVEQDHAANASTAGEPPASSPSLPPLPDCADAFDLNVIELDYALNPLAADYIPVAPSVPPALLQPRPGPDWDAIERDYATGEATVNAICAAHGVTRSQLYHRARIYGWPLRLSNSLAARHRVEIDFSNRLTTALDQKMTQFENHLAENAASGSAADRERDARTLNTLVRLFEKLKGLGSSAPKTGVRVKTQARSPHAAAASTQRDALDTDKLRNELAQRLERLRGQLGG